MLFGVIATTSVVGQASQCPPEWFGVQFNVFANTTFPAAVFGPDINFTFYRDILKFTPEEIERETQNAIDFFSTRYGLNFSSDPDEHGVRHYQNATIMPLRFPSSSATTVNRWLKNGNTKSICYEIHSGGFVLGFAGQQTLHGTYGGEEGIPVPDKGGGAGYGYYRIEICPQRPLLIRFENPVPGYPHAVDQYYTIKSDIFHRTLGQGIELGAAKFVPHNADGSILRYEYQTIMTFD